MSSHSDLPDINTCMPKHLGLYYAGNFHNPLNGNFQDTLSAGTGKVICQVASAGIDDTVAALESAQDAFPAWSARTPLARAKLVREAAQILRNNAFELGMLDALNIGSPISIMKSDAIVAADALEFFAGMVHAVTGETHFLGTESVNYTVREPLGVVARIVASNHPFMFAASKMAPALVTGNTVVIKPPEQAPLSALRMAELLHDVFPPGVLNIIPGGVECGSTLSTHPIVRKITLIGSVPTGKAIQRAAADSLKITTFELGGKNALIGYPDADIDRLVHGVVAGMNWGWAGQSCGSTSRVFLHRSIHDHVLALVAEWIQKTYKPGNPLDISTTMGSMVSKVAQERVLDYIKVGLEEGATLVIGGKIPNTSETAGGFFVEPTIFSGVKQTMRIANEEIFGPVMSVLEWEDEEEMIEQVNSVEYGLTGAIYTSSVTTMHQTARRIQAGTIWINTVGNHYYSMPFGGYKQSGIGRDDCMQEMEDMTQVKAIHIKL